MKLNIQQEELIAQFYFDRYIEESMAYCEEQRPGFIEHVGKTRLDRIIRAIIVNAEACGFDQRGSIWCYMDMVWQFGWDFEHDPQYPWIQRVLDRLKASDQLIQADGLYDRVLLWHDATQGKQEQYWTSALNRLSRVPLLELPVRDHRFETDMMACLRNLYAIRCEYAGDKAMRALIQHGKDTAQKVFHFRSASPQALVVLIAFILGHAFMRNPIFETWAKPLDSFAPHDDHERQTAERLAEGFLRKLRDELTYLNAGRLNPLLAKTEGN